MPNDVAATILLVEDDPGHARLIARNLRRTPVAHTLLVLPDGQAAVDYLCPAPTAGSGWTPTPLLVLLDLHLPGLSGYQVLTRLKTEARTKHIPVIILTTTEEPHDIERCYALGYNRYLTKPVEYAQFAAAIQQLGPLFTVLKIPHGA